MCLYLSIKGAASGNRAATCPLLEASPLESAGPEGDYIPIQWEGDTIVW